MWTACLEGSAAILIACFPVMPRLYRFIRGERQGSTTRPTYEKRMLGSGSTGPDRQPSAGIQPPEWTPAVAVTHSGAGAEQGNLSGGMQKQFIKGWYGDSKAAVQTMGTHLVVVDEHAREKPRGLRPIPRTRYT